MRAVLSSFGTEGAITPFAAIADELARRGHQVSLLTNHRHCERFAGLRCERVPLDSAAEFDAFVRDGHQMFTPDKVPGLYRRYYLPKVDRHLALAERRLPPSEPGVLVASETPGIAPRITAERLGVPLVSVLIQPNHISTQLLLRPLVASVLADDIHACRRRVGLPPVSDLAGWWQAVDRYLALWPEWFAPEFSRWPRTTWVGFVGHDVAAGPEVRARRGDGPLRVLITGGTAHLASRAFFAALCQALGGTNHRKTLLCSQKEMLPPEIPGDIEVIPWIDSLTAAMRSVDVLIHHGGMGTITQALAASVPQLVLADGGDRPENGRIIEALGVGRFLPRDAWGRSQILGALDDLAREPGYGDRCQELALRCSVDDAIARAADCIERAAAPPMPGRERRLEPALEGHPRPDGADQGPLTTRLAALTGHQRALLLQELHQRARGERRRAAAEGER